MVKRAIKLIEDLLPGIGQTVVNMGELNSWLNDSREYNASTPIDRVRETRWSKDAMECPNCKEITLVPQLGGDDMWECMDCHCEVQL
jgi:transposase-like protein